LTRIQPGSLRWLFVLKKLILERTEVRNATL
jgi:hypothetical protein